MGNLILDIEDKTVAKGESFCLNVNTQNFTKIAGMEFTMNYNSSLLTFTSLRNFQVPGLDTVQFGMPGRGTNPLGKIKCSWFDNEAKGVTLADNLSIFQVCFAAKQTDGTTNITFDAIAEIIDSSNKEVVFEGRQGQITVGAGGATTSDNFKVLVGNASVGFGSEVCVPVTIEGFKDIIGLQFKMNYDSTKLLFKSVRNFNSTLSPGGFEESAIGKPGDGLIAEVKRRHWPMARRCLNYVSQREILQEIHPFQYLQRVKLSMLQMYFFHIPRNQVLLPWVNQVVVALQ